MSARAGATGASNTQPRPSPHQGWARLVAYVETTKFRSVVLLVLGTVVGGVVEAAALPGPVQPAAWTRLAWAVLATMLACAGANAITGYVDRDLDAVMRRTRHRPLPAGRLVPAEALGFGLLLTIAGTWMAAALAGWWAAAWIVFGVVDSAGVYNGFTKRRTAWNVILGSPAGGAPVMVGAAAITGQAFSPVPFLIAALVVAWTPVHIWSLAIRHVDDYRAAGVPMLPVVVGISSAARCVGWASLALCGVAAALAWAAGFSPAAIVLTLVLQVPLVSESLAVMQSPTPARARRLFKLSSPYLAIVFAIVIWQALVG